MKTKTVNAAKKKPISEVEIETKVKVNISDFLRKVIEKASAKSLLRKICMSLSFDAVTTAYSPLSNYLKDKKTFTKDIENLETFAMLTHVLKNWDALKKDAQKTLNQVYDEASRSHDAEVEKKK